MEDNPETYNDPTGHWIDLWDYFTEIWLWSPPSHLWEIIGDIEFTIGAILGFWIPGWAVAAVFTFWGAGDVVLSAYYGDWWQFVWSWVVFSFDILTTAFLYLSWWWQITILAALGLSWIGPGAIWEAAHLTAAIAVAGWAWGATYTEIVGDWNEYNGYQWWLA